MKVTNIEQKGWVYYVTLTPNRIERCFGVKQTTEEFKGTDSYYTSGGGNIYVDKNGEQTGNGDYIAEEIDKWRRKF